MDTPYCSTSQPPQPPPLAVAPPTPTPFNHHRINNHPFEDNNPSLSFHPPTTPTTNCSPSPSSSSSFRKKRRSKLLRIDTAAPKQTETTPPCTECGKTFWSWKALFGHMRCHPERQWRGINPPPHLRRQPQIQPPPLQTPPSSSSDDHDVAASLLLLASAPTSAVGPTPRFECSSCKKTFGSHQALGGHRASHKNVKGCFAITHTHTTTPTTTTTATTTTTTTVEDYAQSCLIMSGNNPEEDGLGLGLGLGLGHRCGLCWKVFSTGQALGGHMRRHLLDKNNEEQASSSSSVGLGLGLGLGLDLNHNHNPTTGGRVQEDGWVHSGSNSTELDLRLSL